MASGIAVGSKPGQKLRVAAMRSTSRAVASAAAGCAGSDAVSDPLTTATTKNSFTAEFYLRMGSPFLLALFFTAEDAEGFSCRSFCKSILQLKFLRVLCVLCGKKSSALRQGFSPDPPHRRLDLGRARELLVDAANALHLPLRGESLVETIGSKGAHDLAPRRQPPFPAPNAPVGRIGVDCGEIGADANHRLDRDRARDEVSRVPPRVVPHFLGRLEKVAHDAVEALGVSRIGARTLDALPVSGHPAVDLIEQLGLKDPLLLAAAAAQAIDPVAKGTVALAIEEVDDASGEPLVRRCPGDFLVEIDEMTLVDARRRRVDDHEHLRGEVFALSIEDHARNVDRRCFLRPFGPVEAQCGETVLAVDDQELAARLLEIADVLEPSDGLEVEPLAGKEQDGAWNGRLADRGLVEVGDRANLGLRELALKRLIRPLDAGDEAGDL